MPAEESLAGGSRSVQEAQPAIQKLFVLRSECLYNQDVEGGGVAG
ncbi:hypothetical protein LINGRAHAP2_LOCUS11501 [Linum grandiflorum]